MNGSEFVFLAVGLILGVASGAALVEVLRARPPAPREVRLTVTPDAIPRRRGSTLAQDAFALLVPEPARGGPADYDIAEGVGGAPAFATRTAVRPGGAAVAVAAAPTAMVGFRVEPGRDPMFQAMAHASPDAARAADTAPVAAAVVARSAVAVLEPEDDLMTQARSADASGSDQGTAPLAPADLDGPCGEVRRASVERCELATRARAGVGVADETLRAAQRAYDAHVAKAEAAAAATDPASIRREKESAQATFRDARSSAGSPEAVEAAARDWLNAINRINVVVKEAGAEAAREHQAATAMVLTLERLALEADSARIKAEIAEEACVAARAAVAECVEAEAARDLAAQTPVGPGPTEPAADIPGQGTPGPQPSGPRPAGPGPVEAEGEPLSAALGAGQTPVIFLLLRGDSQTMARTVTRLSDDPVEQRLWQTSLSELVDAIVAISINQSALDFPADHPFWGQFTREQDRDIVTALSSLGYRFDGLGGWLDERVPTQRDVSMAMGYAGLDPMRIRQWPDETGMRSLFAGVTVTADEHLAGAAGDLTLGELVAMLGRRADGLARLWNDWGRVRPLLLEDA